MKTSLVSLLAAGGLATVSIAQESVPPPAPPSHFDGTMTTGAPAPDAQEATGQAAPPIIPPPAPPALGATPEGTPVAPDESASPSATPVHHHRHHISTPSPSPSPTPKKKHHYWWDLTSKPKATPSPTATPEVTPTPTPRPKKRPEAGTTSKPENSKPWWPFFKHKPKGSPSPSASPTPAYHRHTEAAPTPEATATPAPKSSESEATPTPAERPKPTVESTPRPTPPPAPAETPSNGGITSQVPFVPTEPSQQPVAPIVETKSPVEEEAEVTARFQTAKAKAVEDSHVQDLQAKADSATGDDAKPALHRYYRALYDKMREIDPGITDRIDRTEAATMRRVDAEADE